MQSLGPGRPMTLKSAGRRLKEVYESDWHRDLWNYDLEEAVSRALENLLGDLKCTQFNCYPGFL